MGGKVQHGPPLSVEVPQKSAGRFFFELAEEHGSRIFQFNATKGVGESYISARTRSVRAALEMQKRGITSRDSVMLLSANHLDTAIPLLGAFYLGARVGSLDASLSLREAKHLTSLVNPKIIFVDDVSEAFLEDILGDSKIDCQVVVFGRSSKYDSFDEFIRPVKNEELFQPVEVDLDDTIYLMFSSGSTGVSKAILMSHRSYLHLGFGVVETKCNFDVILNNTSFNWISATYILLASFIRGGCRVFYEGNDLKTLFETIQNYKVNFMFLYTLRSYSLTDYPESKNYDTSSLSCVVVGGTPLAPRQLERTQALFKSASVINSYGMSEVGFLTNFDLENDKELIRTNLSSCGKPVPGVSLKVIDPDTEELLGPNQSGEICCKSLSLMEGYQDVDNSETFDADGFLKTGDVGYYGEDGCFYVVDRIKEMFKFQGWRIIPSVLEGVLLEHPEIKEAAVFGIPQEDLGAIPAACVVLKEGSVLSVNQIHQYFSEKVIEGERLRGGIRIVNGLPKTPSGKIRRRQLRDHFVFAHA